MRANWTAFMSPLQKVCQLIEPFGLKSRILSCYSLSLNLHSSINHIFLLLSWIMCFLFFLMQFWSSKSWVIVRFPNSHVLNWDWEPVFVSGGFFCIIVSVDILSMAKHMQPRWDGTQLKIRTMKPRWKNDQELSLKTYLTISEGGWGEGSKFVKVNAQTKWTCASTCNNATTNVRHLYMHMPIHAHRISPTKSSWTSPFLHRLIVPLSKI